MADLTTAIQKMFEREGLYSNDPTDPGGETWMGISRVYNPSWPGWELVDLARPSDAFQKNPSVALSTISGLQMMVNGLYQIKYWDGVQGNQLPTQDLANLLFDMSVNPGTQPAVMMLQQALNDFNQDGKLWEDLPVDGQLGGRTLAALGQYQAKRPHEVLLFALRAQRWCYYQARMKQSPAKEKYALGWAKRSMAS